ncbi:methyl-accepting chemotaxis protein [Polycladidibacter stylochi]|uniref:methyl-accepting chemotaxis protein n=1 Tax=Polycladidibacter stylochi TaxID=1807766 RepID=UPI00082E16FA|nr:nitrate- and nitrite sensing domain-containing protein [Pseudovibrio stylochi]
MTIAKKIHVTFLLGCAIALPMIVVGLFSWQIFNEKFEAMESAEQQLEMTRIAVALSAAIHEQQKERGASSGFIASDGKQFADVLPKQRRLTDQKQKALQELLSSFDLNILGDEFTQQLQTVNAELRKLSEQRELVDGLQLSTKQTVSFYNQLNENMIQLIDIGSRLSQTAHVSRMFTAYSAFLEGKERAGRERAIGAAAYAKQGRDKALLLSFNQLVSEANTYFSVFESLAHKDKANALEELLNSSTSLQVDELRNLLNTPVEEWGRDDVTAEVWFEAITKKINLLKGFEDTLNAELQETITNLRDEASTTLKWTAIEIGIAIISALLLCVFIVVNASKSLKGLTESMTAIAGGDLEHEIADVSFVEIVQMADNLAVFKDNALENKRLQDDQEKAKQEAEAEKRDMLHRLAGEFEQQVGKVVLGVSTAAQQMEGGAKTLAAIAQETSAQTVAAAGAAEEASTSVNTVAGASEELSATIQEVSEQIQTSTDLSQAAADEAHKTNAQVQELREATAKIDEVVQLINDIAEQTNLLALNATIEAARAGEAGRGFAVVASEVKGLAGQTSKATQEIAEQIGNMRNASEATVQAVVGISERIVSISEHMTAISAAAEQQGVATQEISMNAQQAALGTQEVSGSITGVEQAAGETGSAAEQTLKAAGALSQQSAHLQQAVTAFLDQVRK